MYFSMIKEKRNNLKMFVFATLVMMTLISLLLAVSGCSNVIPFSAAKEESVNKTFLAMDTVMDITLYGDSKKYDEYMNLLDEATDLVSVLENSISVTKASSDIAVINSCGSSVVSEETLSIVKSALELCRKTDGALDISIYPVVARWGFTRDRRNVPSDISSFLQYVDYSKIVIDDNELNPTISVGENMAIDLGSVGKGYASDMLSSFLTENGVTSAILRLGGNVTTIGTKPDGSLWTIAITDPANPDGYIGYVKVKNKSVVTSGGYQRFFEENGIIYHHIIDPATGYPASSGLSSVTIIGEKSMECDAYSTALFVMGLQKAVDFWKSNNDFDAVFVTDDGEIYITEGLENVFVPLENFSAQIIKKND